MKHILILLFAISTFAQQETFYGYGPLKFGLKYPANKAEGDYDDIDFSLEQPSAAFTLAGKTPLRYRITLVNDSVARLDKFTGKWEFQEDMPYDAGFQERDKDTLISSFRIEDFDRDGDEDLLCWLFSNMNGNEWTSIYLNDQQQQKLVQLYDHAGDTYVWDAPGYDPATGIISCTLAGSAFGQSAESTHRLNGIAAAPLQRHYQLRGMQTVFDVDYTGHDGKWLQVAESIYIGLSLGELGLPGGGITAYRFDLPGNGTMRLSRYEDGYESPLTYQETVDMPGWIDPGDDEENREPYPDFLITDFNQDGNQDLVFYLGADVHSSLSALIFLSDRKTKKLIKLQNTAEGTDVWDTPEYNPKTKTITCNRISGNAGLSFTSTYKLKGFTAQPLTKEVKDHTNVNGETGKGYSESSYIGKKGKWKRVSTVTDE